MYRTVIADDHPMIRVGVKYSLKEHFDTMQFFEARNGDELLAAVKNNDVDLVLMDLNMPDTDPQRVLQTILALKPDTRVIIFSMNKEEIFGFMYLQMGAMGYLKKGGETQELIKAVSCVLDGNVYIPREMQQFYLKDKGMPDGNNLFSSLTRKELEVLRHLSKGESVVGISRIMNLSTSTVGTHKAHIFTKLRVSNLLELKTLTEIYNI